MAGFGKFAGGAATAPLDAIKAIGGAWGQVISQLSAGIGQVKSQVAGFVAAFSPATVTVFDRAVKDLYASIGEQLLPVLNAFTDVMRWLGDTVAGLTPVIRPLIEQVLAAARPIFDAMGGAIRRTIEAAAPFVQLLGQTLTQLIDAITPVYQAYYDILGSVGELIATALLVNLQLLQPALEVFADLMGVVAEGLKLGAVYLRQFVAYIKDLLGIVTPAIDFDGAARGKGAASSSTTTVSAMLAKLQEQAFGMAESKPTERIPGMADDIREMKNYFKNGDFAKDVAKANNADEGQKGGGGAGNRVGWRDAADDVLAMAALGPVLGMATAFARGGIDRAVGDGNKPKPQFGKD